MTVEAMGGARRHLWDRLDNRFLVTLPRDQNVSILHRVQVVSYAESVCLRSNTSKNQVVPKLPPAHGKRREERAI